MLEARKIDVHVFTNTFFLIFQVHIHSLRRISFLLTLSFTYSMASALEKQSRLLADSQTFNQPIAINEGGDSRLTKTDINGNAKAYGVDYSLYNYGKNIFL